MAKNEQESNGGPAPDFKACADRLRSVFPDAQALFDAEYKPLAQIKDGSLVALDASVLLVPYEMDKQSLREVAKVYAELAKADRLIVPAQAAREFAKNRAAKIGNIVKHLRDQSSRPAPLAKKIGFLEGAEGFAKAKGLSDQIAELSKQLREQLEPVVQTLSDAVGGDPVSAAYREHFKACVRDVDDKVAAGIGSDLADRYERKLPPGYKDAAKDDGGVGDLLIWKTLLQEGATHKRDMIFVTGEEKSDWFARSDGGTFQPRIELLEEYRLATGGQTLHLVALSTLLKLFGAEPKAVEEAKRIEKEDDFLTTPVARKRRILYRHPRTGEFLSKQMLQRRRERIEQLEFEIAQASEKIAGLREERDFYLKEGVSEEDPLIMRLRSAMEDEEVRLNYCLRHVNEYRSDPDFDD